MNGKAEVHRLKQKLDATFERIQAVGDDLELKADFAKYLCVLVSGYLEKAVVELVQEHARRCGAPSLQRFVEQKTRRFTNANAQKLQDLLGDFDPDWRKNVEGFLVDELKDAVDSIVDLRNTIAHGNSVSVTYHRVSDYYQRVQRVVESYCQMLCMALGGVPFFYSIDKFNSFDYLRQLF